MIDTGTLIQNLHHCSPVSIDKNIYINSIDNTLSRLYIAARRCQLLSGSRTIVAPFVGTSFSASALSLVFHFSPLAPAVLNKHFDGPDRLLEKSIQVPAEPDIDRVGELMMNDVCTKEDLP